MYSTESHLLIICKILVMRIEKAKIENLTLEIKRDLSGSLIPSLNCKPSTKNS